MTSAAHESDDNIFEKIKTVGKGAYGRAILYKRIYDDALFIIKKILITDLSPDERHNTVNEIKILSMLSHKNIISYLDSYEKGNYIMIEMEFANDGNLGEYLSKNNSLLSEKVVLSMFFQILSAVKYIHQRAIIHRDIKTQNVFRFKCGLLKLGDFGISKILSTKCMASTVLGTPYYISPEICEGKDYNEKSDIWSLGCLLYEMCCRKKTFDATNIPALVNKIVNCSYKSITKKYSLPLRKLISKMFNIAPSKRPSAEDLYNEISIWKNFEKCRLDFNTDSTSNGSDIKRSILFYYNTSNQSVKPVELPPNIIINKISIGLNHIIVLTNEQRVYAWGSNIYGQLGIDNNVTAFAKNPVYIKYLTNKYIISVTCGDECSFFLSKTGLVLSCGNGINGCLGNGSIDNQCQTQIIQSLISVDVTTITACKLFVLALTKNFRIYVWGNFSSFDNETDKPSTNTPKAYTYSKRNIIYIPLDITYNCEDLIREYVNGTLQKKKDPLQFCGGFDRIFCINDGHLLGIGCNTNNKLGLTEAPGFIFTLRSKMRSSSTGEMVFKRVEVTRNYTIIDVSLNAEFTAALSDIDEIILFGNLSELNISKTYFIIKYNRYLIDSVACGLNCLFFMTVDGKMYLYESDMKCDNEMSILENTELVLRIDKKAQYHKSTDSIQLGKVKLYYSGCMFVVDTSSHYEYSNMAKMKKRDTIFKKSNKADIIENMANSTNILNPKNKEIKQIASRSCPINVTTNISEISSGSTSSLEISTSEYKYD